MRRNSKEMVKEKGAESEINEKLRRNPMKMDVEAEQRGKRVDMEDGWQKAVVKARRRG